MIEIAINQASMMNLMDRLESASMPPAKRRRVMQMIGREVAKVNKQRIRAGKAPDGTKWAPTISKRKHKRLAGLSKRLRTHATADEAIINFDKRFVGVIANQHQKGTRNRRRSHQISFTPSKKAVHDEPCTRRQALRLRELGYTVSRKQGARSRATKPSLKWMQANLTQGKAGIIIRSMGYVSSKTSWVQVTPARPLLPEASNDELMAIAAKAFKKMGWGGSS